MAGRVRPPCLASRHASQQDRGDRTPGLGIEIDEGKLAFYRSDTQRRVACVDSEERAVLFVVETTVRLPPDLPGGKVESLKLESEKSLSACSVGAAGAIVGGWQAQRQCFRRLVSR